MKEKNSEYDFLIPGQDSNAQDRPNSRQSAQSTQLPDFSKMTKQQIKIFDDTEGSYKRLLGERPITFFWLLNHYSKPNAAAYQAQKEHAKAAKAKSKTQPLISKVNCLPQTEPASQPNIMEAQTSEKASVSGGTIYIDRTQKPESQLTPRAELDCLGFGQTVEITRVPFRIGRISNNMENTQNVDLSIADNPAISTIHAEITYDSGNFFITDLNSKNHVYLNDIEIPQKKAVVLRDQTKIVLGNEEFIFHIYSVDRG